MGENIPLMVSGDLNDSVLKGVGAFSDFLLYLG